jgi:MFS family permease
MKLSKILIFSLILIYISILLPIVVRAQDEALTQFWNALLSWGTWVLLLVLGTIIIVASLMTASHWLRISRILFWLGTLLILVGIVLCEFAYVFPLLKQEELTYEKCQEIVKGNILDTAACIIVGYAPVGASQTTQVTFWITGVILPLFTLIYIFYDFVKAGGIITDPNAQKVIAFSFGFIAFRGFLASRFINFLSYGLFGIALLVINLIIAAGLLALGNRFFRKWAVKELERERGSAMKISKEVLKQFCDNIEIAADPVGFFNHEAQNKETYFDVLGLHDEFVALQNCAAKNDANKLKYLARDLKRRL